MRQSGNLLTPERPTSTRDAETKEATAIAPRGFTFSKLLGSTTIILLALLALTAFAMVQIPGRYLDPVDGIPSNCRVPVGKISKFLDSKEQPDLLMLGSSLFLFPSARCDDKMQGKPICYDEWYYTEYVLAYDKSLYFQKLLKDAGFNASVKNLSITSSLMSDHSDLFKTVIDAGKHPKMIVCGLGPRDFIDSTAREAITPTQQLLFEYRIDRIDYSPFELSIDGISQEASRLVTRFKKTIARARGISAAFANDATNHPDVFERVRMNTVPRENTFRDLKTYKKMYAAQSREKMARQAEYLRKMLGYAKKQGIAVLIINMPLTSVNTKLVDPDIYKTYVNTVRKAAQEGGAEFLDIGSDSKYDDLIDFEDCSHLSSKGGTKLFNSIVNEISQTPALANSLSSKQ